MRGQRANSLEKNLLLGKTVEEREKDKRCWERQKKKGVAEDKMVSLPHYHNGFPGGAVGKDCLLSAGDTEMWVQSLGWEDPLEEEMATQSSIFT